MIKLNILLTGGSGFIGKNISESYLAEKYNILSPSHSELNLIDEDSVNEFFLSNSIDIVIHSAGKPGHRNAKDPTNIFYTNTRMFFNLLKNTNKYMKMIVIGSGAIYDMRNYQPKMKEVYFGSHIPADEHGFCKYVIGKHIESMNNVIDLRVFGIFGKYEDYQIRFISNAIHNTLHNKPITIKQNRKFDYIYINDFIPILDHFIQTKTQFNNYNVTPDKSIELYELAEIVRDISGKDPPIKVSERGMGLEYSGNNTRLRKEIPNLEFTQIEKSIKELYNWYEKEYYAS